MAKTITDEDIRLNIIVNGNSAQKELLDLDKNTRKLNATQKELRAEKTRLIAAGKKESQEYKNVTAEIKKNNTILKTNKARMEALQKQIGITGLTMRQLKQRASALRLALNNVVPGGEDEKRYNAELSKISARLTELKLKGKQTKLSLSGVANGFNKYAALGASVIATTTGVVIGMQKMIDYNGKLSDAQSDVQKTTGLTKDEVDELTKSFGILNTRTSRMDLLKIAEEGGRIGIAKEEIGDFVRVMNQANVALGDSFQGGPEEVASKLGKLKLLFKETKDLRVDAAYNAIGSAINELGANGVATEANIAEFTTRIGSLSNALKPTIADALGLGAAFEESGVQAEISGRAYSIFLGQAAKESEKFAKVMGISTQEVENLINTNPTEFFLQFSQRLAETQKTGTDTAKTMADLGLSADGVRKIVGAAGNNTERFREMLELSNKSMIESTSLTNEYNIKNNNLAANLEKIQKKLLGAFSSETITKGLNSLVGWFGKLIGATKTLSEETQAERLELLKLESRVKNVNISAADRLKLIKQFQTNYPGYLSNLDAEKITNEQLSAAIKQVNDQLINKIILQEKEEELQDQREDVADARMSKLEAEDNLLAQITQTANKYGVQIKDNATLEEQAQAILDAKNQNTGRVSAGYRSLQAALTSYQSSLKNVSAEEALSNKLLEEKNKLSERLGIDTPNVKSNETVTPTTTDGAITTDTTSDSNYTPEDQKVVDSKNRLKQFIADWNADQDLQKILREEGKEAEEIAKKEQEYDKLILEAENDTVLKTQLEDIKEAEIQAIKDKWAEIRLEKKKEEEEKLAKLDAEQKQKLIAAEEKLQQAKVNARTQGLNAIRSIFGQESIISKLAFGFQKAMAIQEILINTKKANAQITANLAIANMKSIAASPLTGGMPMVGFNTALATKSTLTNNINAGAQIAGILASSIQGFEGGLYPVQREQDGKLFNAGFGGQTRSGMVNKPTVFMAGENGPELIVDSKAFKQINPDVKNSFMREIARVKGFEGGLYNTTNITNVAQNDTDVAQNDTNNTNNATLETLLQENITLLTTLNTKGVIASMSSDLRTMKQLQERLDDYQTFNNKNKR
jgi:TP901 family phage tail tape measure protein